MNPDRWQRVKSLFEQALDQPAEARDVFLAASSESPSVVAEVRRLIEVAGQAGDFQEEPIKGDSWEDQLAPGQLVRSQFRIVSRLGRGGSGVVYQAEDTVLSRPVALKFLPGEVAGSSHYQRLMQEARAAAALNHPNICVIHEIGEHQGHPFLVMELLEGRTLNHHIAAGPLEMDEMIEWAVEIASALEAAHQAGIIHRDIKPANILITTRGQAKILDFGLAKIARPAARGAADAMSAASTRTTRGLIVGTVPYMSPEQACGEELDGRTDLFSLGTVLYQMATGRLPFAGGTTAEVLGAILHLPPDRLPLRGGGRPAELERIIGKALEKGRDLRYQHAADLASDLKRLRRDTGSRESLHETVALAPAPPAARRKPVLLFVLAAAAFLAMAAAGYYALGPRGAEPFQSMTIERLTNNGDVRQAAISPDGKYLAFSSGAANKPSLWVRQLATQSDLQILPPEAGAFDGITFSNDASYIYYVRESANGEGQLFRVATLGDKPRKILSGVDSAAAISPDGQRVAFLRRTASEIQTLMVAGTDGGSEQALAQRTTPDGFTGFGASWSSDGKLIAIGAYAGGRCYIMTVPAAGGRLQKLGADGWLHVRQIAWLADGSGVVLVSMQSHSSPGQLWAISYPGGRPRRITNDLNDYVDVSVAADSKTLVAVQGEVVSNIWRAPGGDASRAAQLTFGAGTQEGVFGLDAAAGNRLVFASLSGGTRELWTKENNAPPRQLTTDADISYFSTPSLCPDGRTVVYAAGPYGKSLIWRIDSESQKPEALISSGTNGGPSCSPDGEWVYFNALAKYFSLWRVPLKGGTPQPVTNFPSAYPHVSPDGKRVAYVGEEPNRKGIGVVAAAGGPVQTFEVASSSPGLDQVFGWSPSGDAIEYVDTRNGVANIWRQPLAGSSPRQVTNFNSGLIFNFARLPGGGDLAVARGSTTSDVVRIRNIRAGQ